MKKGFIVLLFTCAVAYSTAQVNYILNPSFEQYSHCPTGADQIRYANHWSQIDTNASDPICSPEYCNVCAAWSSGVGIPAGGSYFHYPRSGNGMVQALMYFDDSYVEPDGYYRDYLEGRINGSLIPGQLYCVTFFVTLEQSASYAINHIGAYIDNGQIDVGQDSVGCASPQTSFTPQIIAATVINDTSNWVAIQGSYVADGTERFITIGNFYENSNIVAEPLPYSNNHFSYYLIDDVSIIKSGTAANAGDDTMIAAGDSVYIGIPDEGMPCWWYKYGDTIAIGYSGGIWVKPDTTTSYVVKMNLCGDITYDTVTVTVNTVGVGKINKNNLQIFPNPAHSTLNVSNARGYDLDICNPIGQPVFHAKIVSDKMIIDVSDLPFGVYIARFTDEYSNVICKKVVKE